MYFPYTKQQPVIGNLPSAAKKVDGSEYDSHYSFYGWLKNIANDFVAAAATVFSSFSVALGTDIEFKNDFKNSCVSVSNTAPNVNPVNNNPAQPTQRTKFIAALTLLRENLVKAGRVDNSDIGSITQLIQQGTDDNLSIKEWATISLVLESITKEKPVPFVPSSHLTESERHAFRDRDVAHSLLNDLAEYSFDEHSALAKQKLLQTLNEKESSRLKLGCSRSTSHHGSIGIGVGVAPGVGVGVKGSVDGTVEICVDSEGYPNREDIVTVGLSLEAKATLTPALGVSGSVTGSRMIGTFIECSSTEQFVKVNFLTLLQEPEYQQDPEISRYFSRSALLCAEKGEKQSFAMWALTRNELMDFDRRMTNQAKSRHDTLETLLNILATAQLAKHDAVMADDKKEGGKNEVRATRPTSTIFAAPDKDYRNTFDGVVDMKAVAGKGQITAGVKKSGGGNAAVTVKGSARSVGAGLRTTLCSLLSDPLRDEKVKSTVNDRIKTRCAPFIGQVNDHWIALEQEKKISTIRTQIEKMADPYCLNKLGEEVMQKAVESASRKDFLAYLKGRNLDSELAKLWDKPPVFKTGKDSAAWREGRFKLMKKHGLCVSVDDFKRFLGKHFDQLRDEVLAKMEKSKSPAEFSAYLASKNLNPELVELYVKHPTWERRLDGKGVKKADSSKLQQKVVAWEEERLEALQGILNTDFNDVVDNFEKLHAGFSQSVIDGLSEADKGNFQLILSQIMQENDELSAKLSLDKCKMIALTKWRASLLEEITSPKNSWVKAKTINIENPKNTKQCLSNLKKDFEFYSNLQSRKSFLKKENAIIPQTEALAQVKEELEGFEKHYGAKTKEELLHRMILLNAYLFSQAQQLKPATKGQLRRLNELKTEIKEFEENLLIPSAFTVNEQYMKDHGYFTDIGSLDTEGVETLIEGEGSGFGLSGKATYKYNNYYRDHSNVLRAGKYTEHTITISGTVLNAEAFINALTSHLPMAELTESMKAQLTDQITQYMNYCAVSGTDTAEWSVQWQSFKSNLVTEYLNANKLPQVDQSRLYCRYSQNREFKFDLDGEVNVKGANVSLGYGYAKKVSRTLKDMYASDSFFLFLSLATHDYDPATGMLKPNGDWQRIKVEQKAALEQLFKNYAEQSKNQSGKLWIEIEAMIYNVEANPYIYPAQKQAFKDKITAFQTAAKKFASSSDSTDYDAVLNEFENMVVVHWPSFKSRKTNSKQFTPTDLPELSDADKEKSAQAVALRKRKFDGKLKALAVARM